MILPCGNQLCRRCLPESHTRSNISYPAPTPERQHGFMCPFVECGLEHVLGDCSLDVVMSKVMAVVKADIEVFRSNVTRAPILVEERDNWAVAGVASLNEKAPQSQILPGGRLVATYTMVENGALDYNSEVAYTNMSENAEESKALDTAVLEHLKEATRVELDCQVCYGLFLDPLTTSCGHTFCRKCVRRVLDHSVHCPICRRQINMSPTLSEAEYPTNKRLNALLSGLCPEAVATRAEQVLQDELHEQSELNTPLFICTMSFPHMPTFLHVFEPRYRLMIRRAIEGDGCFGMLLHNGRQLPQGDLGRVPFFQYGTLLQIVSMELLPDGRSLIETMGVSRFRVLKHGVLDAYQVGQIERIDDISLAEEEALEAAETSVPSPPPSETPPPPIQTRNGHIQPDLTKIETMSTQALMEACVAFVGRMKDASAPWLQERVTAAYGPCPTDPALFPWWFGSILPIAEIEKYRLIETRSVRARLKICVKWVMRIEAQRW